LTVNRSKPSHFVATMVWMSSSKHAALSATYLLIRSALSLPSQLPMLQYRIVGVGILEHRWNMPTTHHYLG
ncbi:MAG: hypothetical protein ACOVSW_23905, partial [Candidatus Kapaibacteriota bacterium]